MKPQIEISDTPTSDTLKSFLVTLFESLKTEKIVYCILRNYENLPDFIGNDIDILVHPRDSNRFEACIFHVAEASGWKLLKNPRRYGYSSYWFQSAIKKEYIHFDVWSLIHWKGICWMDEKTVLAERQPYKTFFIPDRIHENCILLVKDLIQIGFIRNKYKETIQHTAIMNTIDFIDCIKWGFNKNLASVIHRYIQMADWEKVDALKHRIRSALFFRSLLRNPIKLITGIFSFFFGYLLSGFIRPNGIFIVLLGPDGSGKSTIANGMILSMKKLFPESSYYHGRFGIIPDSRFFLNIALKFIGKRSLPNSEEIKSASRITEPYGMSKAFMYIVYYIVDYILGYFVIVRTHAIGDIIIFDRYFFDYFVQPHFRNVPRCILRFLTQVIPSPDMIIYLKCAPEEIHRRKPELRPEEIKRQQEAVETTFSNMSNFIEIKTNNDAQTTIMQLSGIITTHMAKRAYQ